MIYRCTFTTVDGVKYLAGYQLVSERGRPEADDEIPAAPGALLTEDGRYRFRIVDNPDFGKGGDTRSTMLVDQPQELKAETAEQAKARETKERGAALAAKLPEILVAVAAGKGIEQAIRDAAGGKP
jgi:hypothetical protein